MAEEDESESIKITLLGNPGVGKTCIIARYIEGTYNENSSSTIGANYSQKTLMRGEREINLDIWDTAGQEKYHSLGKHFYKDSHIVCLVYDITSQESLTALKNIWYPDLKKYGEEYTITAVVGSKCDLYENEDLADENEAKAFANEIKATFFLTSAKSGDGIDKLFNTLTDKYLGDDVLKKVNTEKKNERGNSFSMKAKDHIDDNEEEKKKKKKCCH